MTRMDHPLDAEPIGLFERMCACWTAGDADGYGACFTEDCDYVSYDGTHGEGVAVLPATGSVQMPWRASLPKTAAVPADDGGREDRRRLAGRRAAYRAGPSGEDPRSGLVPGAGVAGPDACRRRAAHRQGALTTSPRPVPR
jgi:hypothetical protein